MKYGLTSKNQSSEKFQNNILDNIERGSIIVFHDNKLSEKILKDNLEDVLRKIRKKGFSFSTLLVAIQKNNLNKTWTHP